MSVTKRPKNFTMKAGTAFLALSMVSPMVPAVPAVTAVAADGTHVEDMAPKRDTHVALVLEGDSSALNLEKSASIRSLLQDFAEKAMPDSASIADNCGLYIRYDDKDAPGVYQRQLVNLDESSAGYATVEDFCRDVYSLQKNSSNGWVQIAFTQNADGSGGVMNNTIFKIRFVDREETSSGNVINDTLLDYLEFNTVDVSPAKQVTITYNYNGGRNTDKGGSSLRGYRYSDEYFDYPDIGNTMKHDTKYFTGWFTTEAAANTLDRTKEVHLFSRFTENTTLYAGWTDVIPPEFYDITYNMPNGTVSVMTGKHAGKYVTKNSDGTFSAEKDIDLSKYIDPESEMFLGYFRSGASNAKEYKETDEVPRGGEVFVRKTHATKLIIKDSSGKQIDSMNIALGYRISKFYDELPESMRGKTFRLTSGKTITLGTTISDRDFSATDSEWEVSCFEVVPPKDTFTVTFDPAGGQLTGNTTRNVTDGETIGSLPRPTMDRKVFEGWYTSDGTKVASSTVVTGNMTLTARWSDAKGVLTFHANGGTIRGNSTVNVTYGSAIGDRFPDVSRDEYVFDGWYTQKDGGQAVDASTVFTDDMTVYAHWTLASNPKNVTFDPCGGDLSGSDRERIVEANSAVGTLPVPTRSGYDFLGWYTAASGGSKISASTLVSDSVTYYAQWKIHTATNKVTSLTLNKTKTEVDYGQELGLSYTYSPANADNAVFYWTSSNENVIRVSGSDTFLYTGSGTTVLTVHTLDDSMSASCTVTVNDVKRPLTELAFDYPEQTVVKGGENNVNLGYHYKPANADNAEFMFSSSDPDIIRIAEDGSSWSYGSKYGTVTITIKTVDNAMTAACRITVKEKDTTDPTPPETVYHTLTFDTAGGNSVPSQRVEDGKSVMLPSASRTGYDFLGWYLDDGTKVTSVTLTSDLTVHARWKSNIPETESVTVRFDAQNGNPATSSVVERGSSIGELPSVSREGYRFVGWFTQSVGGTRVYASTKVASDMTVYAQWEVIAAKKYTLRLHPNQGFINGSSEVQDLGAVLTADTSDGDSLSVYVPERPGYVFTGWFDNPSDGHMVYTADGNAMEGRYWSDGKYIGNQDLQLYAQWNRNTEQYFLRFDVRGGQAIDDVVYDIGSVVTAFPVPVKDGYRFLGWFDSATGGNVVTEVKMNTDQRIFAYWSKPADSDKQVQNVKDLMASCIGTVEFDRVWHDRIDGVRVLYDALTDEQKALIGEDEMGIFTKAESEYAALKEAADTEENQNAAKAVDELIAKIGKVSDTKECKAKIDAARAAYEDLYSDAKGFVTKLSVLEKAEFDYAKLVGDDDPDVAAVHHVKDLVDAVPFPVVYDAACKTAIEKARSAYDGLTEDQKKMLPANYLDKLIMYEQDYAKLVYENEPVYLHFDSQGGDSVPDVQAKNGDLVSDFPAVVREGYEFTGWYTAPAGGTFVSQVIMDGDVTVYAHWTPKNVDPAKKFFTVTLDENYEGGPAHRQEAEEGSMISFMEPVREGYVFDGWYTEKEGGERVVSYEVTADATFFAHWTKDTSDPSVLEKLFWMIRDENGSVKDVDTVKITTKDASPLNDLVYAWTPKSAAKQEDFVLSTSDASILTVVNDNFVKVLKEGEVDLIVTYTKDTTKKAYVHVIVEKDTSEPDDPNKDPDNPDVSEDQKAADAVIDLIDKIGKVELDDEVKDRIDEARDAYDKLTDDQKTLVDNIHVLENAESEYKALEEGKNPDDPNKDPEDPDDPEKKNVEKVFWTNRNDEDRKPVTEITISMDDISNLNDTIFSWTPGQAATSSDFKITSSNPKVIRMKTERMVEILKAGETDLTVTYKGDESKKAVLHVIVEKGKNDTGGDNPVVPIDPGVNPGNPDDPNGGGTDDPNNNGNNGANDPNGNGGNNGGNGSTDNQVNGPCRFRIVFTDGTDRNITVQDPQGSTIRDMLDTLSQLNSKLTGVVRVTMKTATRQETGLDMTIPLSYVTTVAEEGDVLLIGYDASNQPVGSAKISKTGDKSYIVKFSRDTDVDLKSSKDNSDGSGVSDQSKVANTGKSDSEASPVHTADNRAVPVYGGIAAALVAIVSGLAFWKKKKGGTKPE